MAGDRGSIDDEWELPLDREPAPPPPPRPTAAPPAPRLAPPTTPPEPPRGKRRLARGTDPTSLLRRHGLRRVVAQPGQFADRPPLPGVAPLATASAMVAAKVLATFPAHSDAANQARSIMAEPPPPTIESAAPRRRDLTPRTRMAAAALRRFGAVCYITASPPRPGPARADTARLPDEPAAAPRRSLWKRLLGA